MAYGRRRRTNRRTAKKTFSRRRYSRKGTGIAYRALRVARATSRKLAAEVCKFESTPATYTSIDLEPASASGWTKVLTTPLNSITSGSSWIMPINWIYTRGNITPAGSITTAYFDGQSHTNSQGISGPGYSGISIRQPIWYNTLSDPTDKGITVPSLTTELQYRLKYIYINALFNASLGDLNPDGALRIVVVKDKQSTGGSPTWYDVSNTDNSRGVFNSNRIDAQLNPRTLGRFKIMYDRTLRFNTTNAYKPWKYFKRISSVVRNNVDLTGWANLTSDLSNSSSRFQTKESPPPVQKNAYYLMMFPDGVNFNYTSDSTTGDTSFHLFTRVAYYNN